MLFKCVICQVTLQSAHFWPNNNVINTYKFPQIITWSPLNCRSDAGGKTLLIGLTVEA